MKTDRKASDKKPGELEKDLELYTPDDLNENPGHLYLPKMPEEEHEYFLDRIRRYWNEFKPRSVKEYVTRVVLPEYALWKMPNQTHEDFNYLLRRATELSSAVGQEEVALATGLTYAVSQTIYGLKNRSGKHVLSGLQGIITHGKKINSASLNDPDREKLTQTVGSAEKLLGDLSRKSKKK